MENNERIQKKAEKENLPQGNITYMTIRGAKRMYLRWSENDSREVWIQSNGCSEIICKFKNT